MSADAEEILRIAIIPLIGLMANIVSMMQIAMTL
jgi:hypothetical protein